MNARPLPQGQQMQCTVFVRGRLADASEKEVVKTLLVAFVLVVVVVYLFLHSWRATLIPIPVVPRSSATSRERRARCRRCRCQQAYRCARDLGLRLESLSYEKNTTGLRVTPSKPDGNES